MELNFLVASGVISLQELLKSDDSISGCRVTELWFLFMVLQSSPVT